MLYLTYYIQPNILKLEYKIILNLLLTSGVIAILLAIRLRYIFENKLLDSCGLERISNKCTFIHLYSHVALITGYIFVCFVKNKMFVLTQTF